MSNQANPTKVKLQVWMDRGLMNRLDGEAARRGVTRAAVAGEAVRVYLDGAQAPVATRDDVAALRDQVAALADLQKAQAIAIMDGVRSAIKDAPLPALPSGVPDDEVARRVADAREAGASSRDAEVERLRKAVNDARARCRELERELDGATERAEQAREDAVEECRRAPLAARVLGRF